MRRLWLECCLLTAGLLAPSSTATAGPEATAHAVPQTGSGSARISSLVATAWPTPSGREALASDTTGSSRETKVARSRSSAANAGDATRAGAGARVERATASLPKALEPVALRSDSSHGLGASRTGVASGSTASLGDSAIGSGALGPGHADSISGAAYSITRTSYVDVYIPDITYGPYPYYEPYPGTATSAITTDEVPDGAVVTAVDVSFAIVHTWSEDLEIFLADADGDPAVILWDNEGGSADDPARTVTGITAFNGLSARNEWHLNIFDLLLADVGFLDTWSITVHYALPPGPFSLTSANVACVGEASTSPAVRLEWTSSAGATLYYVYRDGVAVGSGAGTTHLDELDIVPGRTYSYSVTALNEAGVLDSNVVEISLSADLCAPIEVEIGPEESFVPPEVEPEAPRVIVGPDGGKAVVWYQLAPGGTIICVQFFDPEGRPLTQPLKVNQNPGDNQTPTASFDDQGNLLVFWNRGDAPSATAGERSELGATQASAVTLRWLAKNGVPLSDETVIASGTPGETTTPESASDLAGNSVVVWQDGGRIRARRVDGSGNALGPAFDVGVGTGGAAPSVAVSGSGDFVVAWIGRRAGGPAILVRRFGDDGAAKEDERTISLAGSPANAAVAMDEAGNSIVVWDADGPSGRDIFTQRFAANGSERGGIRQANADSSGDQTRPRVDVNGRGRFAVVWESTGPGAAARAATAQGPSVVGRIFSPQGEPEQPEQEIAGLDAATVPERPDVSVDEDDDVAVVYERRGSGGRSSGIFRKDLTVEAGPDVCVPSPTTLCLNGGRFRVTALWEEPESRAVSEAQAVPLTGDTGYFWFFEESNVEVVVKALAACPVNGRFWVFAAGLTNVEVTLRVDDMLRGGSKTYFNERSEAFLPILDSDAFATCDASTLPAVAPSEAEVAVLRGEVLAGLLRLVEVDGPAPAHEHEIATRIPENAASVQCATDNDSLCVAGNRFQVEVGFVTPAGHSGEGQATKLTADTGYFWFFDPNNVEIVVKVLNACTISDRIWVFAAGLTDVEAVITVIDTNTGARRDYVNPPGTAFLPIQDTNAFATCP
jgi:hypothetical protein